MPSITLPRIPFVERAHASGASDVAPSAVEAIEESAAQVDEDLAPAEIQQQRTRRVATIIAASILVSAVVSGVATVAVRRYLRQRANSAASGS